MSIDGTLTAIESIEVGMSRFDLDKLFRPEAGLHPATEGAVYIYKECPYIKVNVQFTKDGKISGISRPFLERPTIIGRWIELCLSAPSNKEFWQLTKTGLVTSLCRLFAGNRGQEAKLRYYPKNRPPSLTL